MRARTMGFAAFRPEATLLDPARVVRPAGALRVLRFSAMGSPDHHRRGTTHQQRHGEKSPVRDGWDAARTILLADRLYCRGHLISIRETLTSWPTSPVDGEFPIAYCRLEIASTGSPIRRPLWLRPKAAPCYSSWQFSSQPSPGTLLPSSHSSVSLHNIPSPQVPVPSPLQSALHEPQSSAHPSSHASPKPACTMPSPQISVWQAASQPSPLMGEHCDASAHGAPPTTHGEPSSHSPPSSHVSQISITPSPQVFWHSMN